MKTLKTIIAALLLFIPSASNISKMEAATLEQNDNMGPTHFILCLNSGEQITFLLEHNPKVINGDGIITVVDRDITIEYSLDDVNKYMMGNDIKTDINDIYKRELTGSILNRAGNIILEGFKADVPVTINNINGISVFKSRTNNEGTLFISSSEYPIGIYIVKAGNKTFKFIKR